MTDQQILEELVCLLETHGVQVRSEPLSGHGGGLCRIRGQTILFLDTRSASTESAVVCAAAVGQLLDMETLYIKPQVREFIQTWGRHPA